MFKMEIAMKAFEKSGKMAKNTDNGSYKVILYRQPEKMAEGQYLIEVFRNVPKGQKAPEKPELTLRYEGLTRAITVANQALRGGLETLVMFNKPPHER